MLPEPVIGAIVVVEMAARRKTLLETSPLWGYTGKVIEAALDKRFSSSFVDVY